MKLLKTVAKSLLVATFMGMTLSFAPAYASAANAVQQQQYGTVKGTVIDENGEPVFGAVVFVVGTQNSTSVDFDGNFELSNVKKGSSIRVMLMGYACDDQVWNGKDLKFVMKEESTALDEVVVTAMGIMRKEKSLTYATQLIKADDLFKAPDANIVNSLEGKISGITITPSAGGAGGASKITLRGNKSIMGENAPLIVVDGVPMTNSIRGQASSPESLTSSNVTEGSDYMSMINPDDIESMNVLKGANAAALYGSRAANGVIMITTKKGKEGKMEVTFNSNTTFDMPLMTPNLQNSYGAYVNGSSEFKYNSWGDRLSGEGTHNISINGTKNYFYDNGTGEYSFVNNIHLRNYAKNDINEFFNTGIMTTNSISVAGGTEKIQTYASYSNTYSQGMVSSNRYDRNTFAFRQTYKLWDRLTLGVNVNYVQTKTRNRIGGGKVGNPIYHLYTTPRDTDMDYYKDNYEQQGQWYSSGDESGNGTQVYYLQNGGNYTYKTGHVLLTGPMQNYSYMAPGYNNPYWLTQKNYDENIEDRFSASFNGTLKIIEGLNLQARVSLDHTKYNGEGYNYATTWYDVEMYRYGRYWLDNSRTNEIYTDYMLSYNKELGKDWSISATAGYVGHTIKGYNSNTYIGAATIDMTTQGIVSAQPGEQLPISTAVNRFDPSSGSSGVTGKSKSSNWDQAALATAQIGWKDVVFVDASYRHDWYRPFKQFAYLGTKESYGYFGVGANAILSDIIKLPKWFNYAKYRLSYSEVGNSIPNVVYAAVSTNDKLGTTGVTSRNSFIPEPEKTKSFETGLEMQFFRDCLNLDITYYNSAMHKSYLEVGSTSGKSQPVNSGIIRNQGVEMTVGYDWAITNKLRWKTSLNFSYNHNRIEATAKDESGNDKDLATKLANGRIQLLYRKGGSYGDIYVSDFTRYREDVYKAADGTYNITGDGELVHKKGDIYLTSHTYPNTKNVKIKNGGYASVDPERGLVRTYETYKKYQKYAGNLNSPYQLSWSNTFTYKDFTLYFLINGRIGGKVISLTEAELDYLGASERSGAARLYAEEEGLYMPNDKHAMYLNDGRDMIGVEDYYTYVGTNDATSYIYDATNFRLRELSLGYTFRNLFGEYKNLSISFVCRNLFFIYKDSPVDPDVSLSTANGLGGIDMFNYPSPRSFGFNLKVNL
ncbi:MAG: SusC/RagA family TonB-linked outer membrane protein [Bacteroidaceae bacterium]|nr:SusC/RagA family TonB-linked outer membrane protein [Bacteroidaceae bacterium]